MVSWEESESKQIRRQVFAPNHIHKDLIDQEHCSATGWIKTEDGKLDKRFETPYESLFWQSMLAIVDHEFVPQEPLFERLNIEVELPFKDIHLAFGNEIISLREALHEEYYFSLLEWVQVISGKPSGSRDIRPGQIVPNIRYGENYKVRVMLENYSHSYSSSFDEYSLKDLDKCSKPLELSQVNSALKGLMSLYQGEKFEGRSILGETILGALFNDENPSVSKRGALITGAQHANETTGVVGLLRASSEYLSQTERHPLAIIPVHNVDGYKLYHELLEDNTYHMHHAARYSAHGNDVEYQQPQEGFERAARDKGLELADAVLHLNLHGYPAHEWTRPLTGYIPKNFDLWSIPKGFFLIMRHWPDYQSQAKQLIDHVTSELNSVNGLLEYNQTQLAIYEAHNGEISFDIINGLPVLFQENSELMCPLTLITEFPDESVQGDQYTLGHEAQKQTILAALSQLGELQGPQ
ncbi:hypothetical protein JCM19236_3663 [Vibrio sp. JCM 19236]|nr:hypothetical protein JCM19236_3663 [Vibrio sp. JCM 19236]